MCSRVIMFRDNDNNQNIFESKWKREPVNCFLLTPNHQICSTNVFQLVHWLTPRILRSHWSRIFAFRDRMCRNFPKWDEAAGYVDLCELSWVTTNHEHWKPQILRLSQIRNQTSLDYPTIMVKHIYSCCPNIYKYLSIVYCQYIAAHHLTILKCNVQPT